MTYIPCRCLAAAAVLALCPQLATSQTGGDGPRIDAHSAWHPAPAALSLIRKSCENLSFPALGECFARGMQRSGASPEAMALTHRLDNEAYLHDFIETGEVDLAFVTYPFRANQNEACFLVNGSPAMIDVDNIRQLSQDKMKQDHAYQSLAAAYPNLSLWPGDRGDQTTIVAGTSGGGGQRFVVSYWLLDGCHACARLASVKFAFDFDAQGKFLRPSYLSLQKTGK
jgi:hypothetical protein